MKVFAYCRVSTKEQLNGGGFDRQQNKIAGFCDKQGWRIVRTFEDQQSGGTEFDSRAGLHEILSLAGANAAHGIETIVVEDASRIARDLMVQEIFLSECRKKGIKVYAADSGEELVMADADPTRVLIRQLLGALAQWEKAQLVLKLQAGRRKVARETGEPCGGPKPYGQTDAERAMIATIVKCRNGDKWTFRHIARYMQGQGFPAPNGRYWFASTVGVLYTREMKRRQEGGK
jgi:DNA invertase Pin-like site-specific DNA recombinase